MSEAHRNMAFDAIVVGGGVAGIYATHVLKNRLGLNVLGIERGDELGGTWYWNRYPGVQADTDAIVYRYSFDQETASEWDDQARYQNGRQIRNYLGEVAARHGVEPVYRYGRAAVEARYLAQEATWRVEVEDGEVFTAPYLVSAAGVFSRPVLPDIPGLDDFAGDLVHSARWPEGITLDGKRVGVVGTGSTGGQLIVAAGKVAEELVVFQRTPQYIVPAGQRRMDADEVRAYRENFEANWEKWRATRLACGFDEPTVGAMEVSAEERQAVFERAWERGSGFEFMFGTFGDLAFNRESNDAAADFIKQKIRSVVEDPEVAERLVPTEPYAKRPASVDGYYETFNQDNVELVDVRSTAIRRVVPSGVELADGTLHELDTLVFATGFEAIEGAYRDFHVVGRNGTRLLDAWGESPAAYLGIATPQFPNFFTLLGPQGVFSNLPPGIEAQMDFVGDLITWSTRNDGAAVEVSAEVLANWNETCGAIANASIFAEVKSWIFGSNVHSEHPRPLFFFGGLGAFRELLDGEREKEFASFHPAL